MKLKRLALLFSSFLLFTGSLSAASLSFSPPTFPFSGKVEIAINIPTEGQFPNLTLNQNNLTLLWGDTTYTFDTTKYPDGLYLLTLSYIFSGKVEREHYFITIKNTEGQNPTFSFLQAIDNHEYSKARECLSQAKEESKNQFVLDYLTLFEAVISDLEQSRFSPDIYKTNKDNLKLIALSSQSFPSPDLHYLLLTTLANFSYHTMDFLTTEEAIKRLINQYSERLTKEDLLLYCQISEMEGRDTKDCYQRLRARIDKPENPEGTLLLGLCELNLNNEENAREIFNQLLTKSENPRTRDWAIFYLAVIQLKEGDFEKALSVFEAFVITKREDRLDDYANFYAAECYTALQYWQKALQRYHRAGFLLSPIPKSPEALYKCALTHYKLKNYKQVEIPCHWISLYHPNHPLTGEAKYLTAEALLAQNQKENWGIDPEERLNHLLFFVEDIVKQYPNTALSDRAYYLRAEAIRNVTDTYHKSEDHVRARTIYAKLVGYEAVGMKEPEGDGKENDTLRTNSQDNPLANDHFKNGEALYKLQSYEAAIEQYRIFLSLAPNHKETAKGQYHLGISYAGLQKYEKSIEELLKVPARYPKSEWAENALERAATYSWERLNDATNAVTIYQRIIKEYPESISAGVSYYQIASIYCSLEDYKTADKFYRELIERFPTLEVTARAKKRLEEVRKKQTEKNREKMG